MNRKIEITNDVFDIAKRIKEIDGGYFVMYDRKLNRFEIHNKRQRPNTLSLTLPYDTLDCRAIDKVLSTRTDYIAARLAEIEKYNEKLCKDKNEELKTKRLKEGQELFRRLSE